jgi:O-antigen/teichoic acid export membrane protein
MTAALNKCIGLISTLISVPLTLSYLTTEQYGLWLSLSAAVAVLAFADLGVGNQLLNSVSAAMGQEQPEKLRSAVSSAWFTMIFLAIAAIATAFILLPQMPLDRMLGVHSSEAKAVLLPSVLIMAVCFALNLPFDVVQRTQMGMQAIFQSNLWRGIGSLLSLLGIVISCRLRLPFPCLVFSLFGLPLCATIMNFVHFFRNNRHFAPCRRDFRLSEAKQLLTSGTFFVSAGAGASVLTAAPVLLTSNIIGASAAAVVGVALRLYLIPYSICEFFWSPLWPAYGEAWAKKDFGWINRTVWTTVSGISVAMAFMVTVITVKSSVIIAVWTGGRIAVPITIAVATGVLMFVRVFRGALSMPANGCGYIRTQAILFALSACCCFLLTKYHITTLTADRVILFCGSLELMITAGIARDVIKICRNVRLAAPVDPEAQTQVLVPSA